MAYISLYRKYRPQTFEDVVGQDAITTALKNAIGEGRVASGYLFTGTRGTAKTTCARILAKALNCIGADGTGTAPNPHPCGVCAPCRSIAASSFVDVLEMDAASHGKVDDVRDLVASIKFPPMEGRYKVYIIDEAHQLSRDAMDAFLKTLEEPPDRVVFVLATTEIDKLPITIASRCQVYEFKRGSVAQISSRLLEVLANEGVGADPAAVTLIARAADGSYRDSLSLLEQVLAYQREHLTAEDVTVVLGTIGEDLLARVVDLIADSDAAGAFAMAGDILESGKDVRQFLKSLSERFRDMLFVGVGARPAQPGEIDDSETLRTQAARFAPAALLTALETLTAAEQETKRSTQHRLILEMSLLRLMRLPSSPALPESPVLAAPVAPTLARPGANGKQAAPIGAAPETPAVPYEMPPPLAEEELDALPDEASETVESLDLIGSGAPQPGDDDLDILPFDDREDDRPSEIVVAPPVAESDLYEDELVEEAVADESDEEDLMTVQQVAAAPAAPAPPPPAPADTPPELLRLQKNWPEVVNRLSARPATAAVIRDAEPVALLGNVVILQFTSRFNVEKIESNEKGRQVLEDAINKTLGPDAGPFKVKALLKGQPLPTGAVTKSGTANNSRPTSPAPAAPQQIAPAPAQEPDADAPGSFVEEVIAVFGGRLLDDDAT